MDACLDRACEPMNRKLAGLLFDRTKDYPVLHSSHTMDRAVCTALAERVPEVIGYLRARMIRSPQLSVEWMLNQPLREEQTRSVNRFEYIAEEFPIWADKREVGKRVFNPDGIPRRLELCFFDIPYIVDQSRGSDRFFRTLAVEDVDHAVFEEEIVQIIIERAWRESAATFFLFLALPQLTLQCLFFTWSNYLTVPDRDEDGVETTSESKDKAALLFCYLILGNIALLALQELWQMHRTTVLAYLSDLTNLVELTPLVSATLTMALYLQELHADEPPPEWAATTRTGAQIVTCLVLWVKLLGFLRPFKAYGHLIRMVQSVFADMAPFMGVFAILVVAFSDAFYTESNALPKLEEGEEGGRYLANFFLAVRFSYETALGALDTDHFQGFVPWLLFFAVTVFNLIVLLNLLIAIISETYERVTATRAQHAML